MNIISDQKLIKPFNEIDSIFSSQGVVKARKISLLALSLASVTGKNFHTCEKRVNRFLDNQNFQVNDALFRCHKNLIFTALKEMI